MMIPMLLTAVGGPLPPAGSESGSKTFNTDDRTNDGWHLADIRNTSFVDTAYHKWTSYDGTSNIWKNFGTLGTSFIRARVGTHSNTSYKISYEGPGRSVVLEAHSFTNAYPYSHDYTMTVKVDGVEVWSGTIPGPGDVYDPRSMITLEYLDDVDMFRFIAGDTVYHTITDARSFDTMRVWFNRDYAGAGLYGVDFVEWYVQ